MAAIHDRYAVLPSQHRTTRPGALLRAVLKHRDSARDRYLYGRGPGPCPSPAAAAAVVIPAIRTESYCDECNSSSNNSAQTPTLASATGFSLTVPGGGAVTGTSTTASALTATQACATAAASGLTAPTGPASIAAAAPSSGLQTLNPNSSSHPPLFIRHARSTSSPLPGPTPPLLVSPPPTTAATLPRRPSRLSSSIVTMPEYRHMRSGSLSIPNGVHGNNQHHHSMPRSPPNTSHVPCKFYRQGACQAGNACPFSHDLGAAAENICKYFAKGNCKFGPKCANIHVLPDGRRINYGKNGVTIGPTPINLANRPATNPAAPTSAAVNGPYNPSTASALTTSLYRADQPPFPYDERQQHPHQSNSHHLGRQPSLDNGLPTIDTPYSHPNSNYGSPHDDDSARLGFGLSPAAKGLSVLDAPLPASFDSNGISNAARFPAAPWPSSVPSKFGLESPSPSLSSVKDSRTSETLKLLHTSAFGSSEHLITPTAGSPPDSRHLNGEEYFGKRAMHSSRYAKPKMLSASVPKNMISVDQDWADEFAFGDDDNVPENLVPVDLDLLTPAEKARRGSMRTERPDLSLDGFTKYGSPMGSSPSRWGPLFQRQKEEEDITRSARGAAGSAFGHVGSPLRNSTLAQEMSDDFPRSNGMGRPSAIRSGSETMSVLSQQLQRNRLDDTFGSSSPLLHPTTRSSSNGIGPIGKDRAMERHVSSGSIGSSGRFATPIDEEDPAFVFTMEEEDESPAARIRKRASPGLALGGFTSYAGAVSGKGAANGSKEGRDAVPVNGR